ncbi:MAG: adenylosuccinate synthase [Gemmatimonadota bacterium]|nr:adenylosuccinate synthase [Gemmatimonadota bacterium]
MSVRIVIGAQWGDEGKGKIVDFLSDQSDMVVRFQGGANAGHTVAVGDKEYILHLIPCGILRPDKICVIGNGVVIDPAELMEEIDMLRSHGIDVSGRLFISQNAQLIMPYHKFLDQVGEQGMQETERIGTTGRGIGPAYTDKVARKGIRIVDLLDRDLLREKLKRNIQATNTLLDAVYHADTLNEDQTIDEYLAFDEKIDPFITDTSVLVNEAIDAGKSVLFEGGQGTLLDVDHGTYPYVTSSNTVSGAACTGVGVGPTRIDEVIGVVKAYTTRVGNGPFPTEFPKDWGNEFRQMAHEYGATTGRPRRCGWFDAMIARYAARVNGMTSLAISRMDTLDELASLRICVEYKDGDKVLKHLPSDSHLLDRVEAVYEEMDGWQSPTSGARTWDDLPEKARTYITRISELTGVPVGMVSVGSRRDETIFL